MKNKTQILAIGLTVGVVFAIAGVLCAADSPSNVAGTWQMTLETARGTMDQTLTLQQDGGKIKGTLTGRRGDSPIEGTVEGNKVNFTVKRDTPNGTFTIEYTGTADGDAIAGTFHSERFDGKWTAKRGTTAGQK